MDEYRRYPVAPCKAVCALCITVLSLASAGGTCQPAFIESTWTLIEVLDSRSGNPVTDVTVTANGTVFFYGEVRDPGPAPIAPTDIAGRTYAPLARIGDRPYSVDLSLRLEHGQLNENITIPNRNGASVETENLTVRILDVEADGPPPPLLAAVIGSQPAQILVNGYVSRVHLCSKAENRATTRLESNRELGAYVGPLSMVDVPLGFESIACSDPDPGAIDPPTCGCPPSILDRIPSEGFALIAIPTFSVSGQWVEGESFCLDSEGTVIACP